MSAFSQLANEAVNSLAFRSSLAGLVAGYLAGLLSRFFVEDYRAWLHERGDQRENLRRYLLDGAIDPCIGWVDRVNAIGPGGWGGHSFSNALPTDAEESAVQRLSCHFEPRVTTPVQEGMRIVKGRSSGPNGVKALSEAQAAVLRRLPQTADELAQLRKLVLINPDARRWRRGSRRRLIKWPGSGARP